MVLFRFAEFYPVLHKLNWMLQKSIYYSANPATAPQDYLVLQNASRRSGSIFIIRLKYLV